MVSRIRQNANASPAKPGAAFCRLGGAVSFLVYKNLIHPNTVIELQDQTLRSECGPRVNRITAAYVSFGSQGIRQPRKDWSGNRISGQIGTQMQHKFRRTRWLAALGPPLADFVYRDRLDGS